MKAKILSVRPSKAFYVVFDLEYKEYGEILRLVVGKDIRLYEVSRSMNYVGMLVGGRDEQEARNHAYDILNTYLP